MNSCIETQLPPLFPTDYTTSRTHFRTAVEQLGAAWEAFPIAGPDEAGAALTVDVARLVGRCPDRVLVLSSGLHGVEGFFGSAVQAAVLAGPLAAAPRVTLLLLHALNPYGFANLRRFDAENIDPNRNFLLPTERYEGSPPGYAELDTLLNPQYRPSRWPFWPRALAAIARRGMPALKQAVAGGQYEFPRGLFFGGRGPCATMRLLETHLGDWLAGASRILHLDFHTGLGRFATYKLLSEEPPGAELTWLQRHFGAENLETAQAAGVAYHVRGGLGTWCKAQLAPRAYTYLCAEFGTYGPLAVVAGLRAENQAHQWGDPGEPATRRAKQRLLELFCPASPRWREQTLRQAGDVVQRAVDALLDNTDEAATAAAR